MHKTAKLLFLFFLFTSIFAATLSAMQSSARILTVQEAVRMMLDHSPDILLARAQTLRSREAVQETRSLNRPRAYAGTGLAYNNGMPLSIEGSAPSIFQVNAAQPFLSMRNSGLIHEAEEMEKAGRFGEASARNALALRTATVYGELHRVRKALDLTAARLAAAEAHQKEIEALLEAGRVLPVEATLVRTAVLAARQQVLVMREQGIAAERELRELIGLPDTVEIRTVEPNINEEKIVLQEDALFERALETAPGILQAKAEVTARDFHTEAEKGERWPKMEIVSQYALLSRANNYEDFFSRFVRNNYLIGLSVQVPLPSGTGVSARIAQSRIAASEARYKLQRLQSELRIEIQKGVSALRIAQGAADLAKSEAEASRELLRVNETLMESGRITQKDLEDSRSRVMEKEMAALEAEGELFKKKLDLLYSTGEIETVLR